LKRGGFIAIRVTILITLWLRQVRGGYLQQIDSVEWDRVSGRAVLIEPQLAFGWGWEECLQNPQDVVIKCTFHISLSYFWNVL